MESSAKIWSVKINLSPLVAQAAVRSKAVILLLLIHCLLLLPLFAGGLVLNCFIIQYLRVLSVF